MYRRYFLSILQPVARESMNSVEVLDSESPETESEAEETDNLLNTSTMEARAEHEQTKRFYLMYGIATGTGAALFSMILFWLIYYRKGFAWTSDPGLEFNWHPLLMTTGMLFIYSQSMLIYRSARHFPKKILKLSHGFLHMVVFMLLVIGLKAVFDSHNLKTPPTPNLYTLHSWIGLITVILFSVQLLAGFVTFLYPGLPNDVKRAILPVHVNFGSSIFIMAIVASISGLLEKAVFALSDYAQLPREGVLINLIGVFLLGFSLLVLYLVTDRDYKRENLPEDGLNLVNETHEN